MSSCGIIEHFEDDPIVHYALINTTLDSSDKVDNKNTTAFNGMNVVTV